MNAHTEYLEKKLDDEIESLKKIVCTLCEENTDMQKETIRSEKELIYDISELFTSSIFKRAFNETEISDLKKEFDENKLYIGSSQKILNDLKKKIEKGIEKRKSKETRCLEILGINDSEIAPYKALLSSDVFLDYFFATHII